jgi:flagellar basal body L-ring protein FlgH
MTITSQRMRACQASAALAALLTLAACGDKAAESPAPAPAPSAAAAPAATAPAPAPQPPQQDEEAAAAAKMQTYIAATTPCAATPAGWT